MSKRLKLAPRECATSVQPTNWDICALCQEHGGTLINPSATGYLSLATNLSAFHELNKVPLNINVSRLDDGDGMEKTMAKHKARWHKTCYVLCNAAKVERARKLQEKACMDTTESPHKKHLRSSTTSACPMDTEEPHQPACFFCDGTTGDFHKAETMSLDTRVRKIATELQDRTVLAKLSAGDMIAIDAVYHLKCLTSYYNKHRSQQRHSTEKCQHISADSLAFAEVVTYIEEYGQLGGDRSHIFKLTDLKALYSERLQRLGGVTTGNIHSTRLTQKLLHHIPDLEAHNSNFGTVLSFKDDIGDALLDACHPDPDDEAVMLMRVAKLVRKEVLEKKYKFIGSLCDEQYDDLPVSLSALVELILEGPNAGQRNDDNEISTAASSITQLLVFNAVKRGRKESVAVRHNSDRETVLPLYLGLLIHNKTRKRDLIDVFFEKGLSVSYDRVLQLSTDEANRVIDMYEREGIVRPSTLRDNLFTTGNLDNIDHNPSSTSSLDSFHGTAISITQHITNDNPGVVRVCQTIPEDRNQQKLKSIKALPMSYTNVPPIALPGNIIPAVTDEQVIPATMDEDQTEVPWFEKIRTLLADENFTDILHKDISWSAYFASQQVSVPKPPAIIALLPLFRDAAHSPAMVKHGMDIIQQIAVRCNPDQIPVLTVDQPLYAIAKRIQWKWPEKYGERRYVVMMGGLHIEMALLKVIGDWLDGSGWTYMMTSANVTTEGRAASLQKGSHTSRGQWAHQITAAALFILLHRSYGEYQQNTPEDEQLCFDLWCNEMASMHPQFDYWFKVWQLERLLLQFLRSQRQPNFASYLDSLGKIIPWMFALDHFHYSRWMAIHVKDLLALENNSPATYAEFLKGNFVTQKCTHKFSALAHDQVHEQLNAMVKGDGGAIGITENEAALTRWMVAGPETARLLIEYDEKHSMKKDTDRHHEQIPSVQKAFILQVKNVTDVMEELGNPFADTGTDLYTLDTKRIMPDSVVNTIKSAENIGKTKYQKFVAERINGDSTTFNETIHKNNLPLFNSSSEKKPAKSATKISNLCDDVNLFSRMYISCQARDSDMDAFFMHENHAWPPSLASNRIMHQSTKSDLMECLESLAPKPESTPNVDVKIVDGAALVHALDPKKSKETVKTFQNYSQLVFLPCLERMLQDVARLDVVWDIYKEDSLKSQTRQNRGTGNHIRVANNTKIPANWKNFLLSDSNKESLFQLLADAVQEFQSPQGNKSSQQKVRVLFHLPLLTSQTCPALMKKRTPGSCFMLPMHSIKDSPN